MTKIEALKKSIEKWENIAFHGGIDDHAGNCQLCIKYHKYIVLVLGVGGTICDGCPVKEKTGKHGCKGTPYEEWCNYIDEQREGYRVFDDHSKQLAINELEFLKSLLKEIEGDA